MGKKKRQKMKELSVAIAESSSIQGAETAQPEVQPQAPRKRGRPRKIIVVESEEKKIQAIEKEAAASTAAQGTESSVKKEGQSAACISVNTKEEEIQLPKGEPSRSRARRKSKPRKST